MDYHRKVRKIRELRGYSQDYVAGRLGISTKAYSKVEAGITKLSLDRLEALAAIFEMKPEEIMAFDEHNLLPKSPEQGEDSDAV
jgi:transcriptional regulator with XRE-family HTH domain